MQSKQNPSRKKTYSVFWKSVTSLEQGQHGSQGRNLPLHVRGRVMDSYSAGDSDFYQESISKNLHKCDLQVKP